MDDIWFYILSFLEADEMIILSHVNKNLFLLTRRQLKQHDLFYLTMSKNYKNVISFLLEQQYHITTKSVNLAIQLSQFEILNRIKFNFNHDSLITAILSNNLKMVKFIKKKISCRYNHNTMHAIMLVDNPKIYQYLIGGMLTYEKLVLLVNQCCIQIIESYRFGGNSRGFETIVKRHAEQTQNQYMIQYCIDHDYGNH
jgi:hypothetical protein